MTNDENKNYKGLLIWGIKIVAFLFAAFGGFLTKFAPPSQIGVKFPVGIASFLLLVVLLIVKALGRQVPGKLYRRRWIFAGVICLPIALVAGVLYSQAWEKYTYGFPCEQPRVQHVKAADVSLSELARKWVHDNPLQSSACELEMNLPTDQIWSPEAINAASRTLLLTYVGMVLTLATALFSLVEANSPSQKKAPGTTV
jgi:hypothetical protein